VLIILVFVSRYTYWVTSGIRAEKIQSFKDLKDVWKQIRQCTRTNLKEE